MHHHEVIRNTIRLYVYAHVSSTLAACGGHHAAPEGLPRKFGRPPVDPAVIAEKLEIAQDARKKGRTAAEAASLVGWSRATLYRHQQAARDREILPH